MKILNSFKIDKKIQKVVETPEGYILNGHYYGKDTMSPRALDFYPTYGDPEDIAMNRRLSNHTYPSLSSKTRGDAIITDREDPTISYIFTCNYRTNSLTLLKIRELNGECQVLNTIQYGAAPGNNSVFNECIGQDATYLYCLLEWNTTGGATTFVKIDKATLAQVGILSTGTYCGGARGIYEDENFIFWGFQRQYGHIAVYRFKKNTGVNEAVTVPVSNGTIYFSPVLSDTIVKSPTEVIFYAMHQQSAPVKFNLIKYTLNPSEISLSTLATTATCDITWGDISEIPVPVTAGAANRFELLITEVENKQYLNVVYYESGNSIGANNSMSHGIYTFLIDNETKNLTYKSKINNYPMHLRGVIGATANLFLVAISADSTYFYSFNKAEEKYVLSQQLNNQPLSIGIDTMDRIWVENGLSEIDMYSLSTPTQVNVKFEKPAYSYEGAEIDSFVTIDAVNYNGDRIESTLELTLKGNAVFTSTGNKTVSDVTGLSDVKQIPIKVTGAGSVSVYIKVII